MASKRTLFRSLWDRRNSRRKQRASRPSGTSRTTAQPLRNAAHAMLPSVGSGLAALAILACAFGPMPDESATIDVTMGKEAVGAPRKVIDKFLADSRQYLGL